MFLYQKGHSLDDKDKATLGRINNSASRMQVLITDLVSLTGLTKIDEPKKLTDLNSVFTSSL